MKWKASSGFALLKDSFAGWSSDNVSTMSAALSYYTVFSLAPLLLVVISVAGLFFGKEAVQGQIVEQIGGLIGTSAASTIQNILKNTNNTSTNIFMSIVGTITLILGATGVFGQLKDSLNRIFGVVEKSSGGIFLTIRNKILSFSMVLTIGFLLIVSLEVSALLNFFSSYFREFLPVSPLIFEGINFLISFAVISFLFAAIYKVLPDVVIPWRQALLGGAVTSILFTIGKTVIGIYLGRGAISSTYGAAASLAIILVWVYYASQIFLFGAEFVKVYAQTIKKSIRPSKYGELLLEQKVEKGSVIPRQYPAIALFAGVFVMSFLSEVYHYLFKHKHTINLKS